MFRWIPYAMVRAVLFFAAGIVLAVYQPSLITIATGVSCCAIFLLIYLALYLARKKFRSSVVAGFFGLIFLFLAGYTHTLISDQKNLDNHLSRFDKGIDSFVATIKSGASGRDKSWRYVAEVESVQHDGKSFSATGNIYLYWSKSRGDSPFFYGDKILLEGAPTSIQPPGNPHEFDYKRFLGFRNIYHQYFAGSRRIEILSKASQKNLIFYSLLVRDWATNQIVRNVKGEDARSIAMALSLGVTDGIDNELQGAYSASGAMHVLAVSGLHVGILYAIVLMLLRPLQQYSSGRWIVTIVSLVVLWGFAFVTGLSPSVQRAVMMFSFVAIAKSMNRSVNIYNTLAASAFVLLMIDPFLIMSVGFQLSYLAVIGILALHRPIFFVWEPVGKFMSWIWNITCVSIAAQLATFALGLLYFHQFPVYFMFSNLFVIPGAIIILGLCIALIALSFLPVVASGIGWVLERCIELLNYGVFSIEHLPFSVVRDVYIDPLQTWMLAGIVVFIFLLFFTKKFQYLLAATACTVLFCAKSWIHFSGHTNSPMFVVYNVSGQSGFEWIDKNQSFFYGDSVLLSNTDRVSFHIHPNRLSRGVVNTQSTTLNKGITITKFRGKSVAYVNHWKRNWTTAIDVDYLIVAENAFRSFEQIPASFQFKELILDSSNSFNNCETMTAQARQAGKQVHSIVSQGAFTKNI